MSAILKQTVVLLLVLSIDASAQNTAIPWSAIAMGGTISASANTHLRTVIGQSAVGQTRSLTSLITSGFLVQSGVGVTAVNQDTRSTPEIFALMQNYPIPFNPSTTIRYGLPHKSQVSLMVYNTLGQLASHLVSGEQEAGYHEVKFDASGLSSGVYFYRLQAGTYVETRKLLLLR